jgi:hypothetical protein
MAFVVATSLSASAAFVYETPAEFLTSGDFNGDGIADVLVLDKLTGNARVGYQDASGNLTWSAPLVTGVENATGCGVGRWATNLDAVAVTSPQLNRVYILTLSNAAAAGLPLVLTPGGVGPQAVVALGEPFGVPTNFDSLLTWTDPEFYDPSNTLVELFGFLSSSRTFAQTSVTQAVTLARGNSLVLGADPQTLLAAIQRGPTNDQFVAYSISNNFATVLTRSNLPSGSDYVFGTFNTEPLPRFIFYVPGQSNLVLNSLVPNGGGYSFDAGVTVTFAEAVQQVYYVARSGGGYALVLFGDGVRGLTVPAGTPVVTSLYSAGAGAAGNVFTGVVPLGSGNFALLDAPAGSPTAVHGQDLHFDGSNFTQRSSRNLPSITARGTRANVWLFQSDPFVTSNPTFVGSSNAPDWSLSAGLSGGVLSVVAQTDNGTNAGLSGRVTNNFGAAPAGANFTVSDQYQDSISLFSYGSPRPPEQIELTISPAPGLYGGPVQVSLGAVSGSPRIFYRVGALDTYHQYGAPFSVASDATIQYYGDLSLGTVRSRLYAAGYSFGASAVPTPQTPANLAPGSTNPAPVLNTNTVLLSTVGTVFYGRRGTNDYASIWAIDFDGNNDHYITDGARPRVSRDGRHMAFLRDGQPFNNQGNIWVRDLQTGAEALLVIHTNRIVCYDWDLTETNLIFDYNCGLWQVNLGGQSSPLPPLPTSPPGAPASWCDVSAPVVNPVNGGLAFFANLNALYYNMFTMSPDTSFFWANNFEEPSQRWPNWAPNGQQFSVARTDLLGSLDHGLDLGVIQLLPSNTNFYYITDLRSVSGYTYSDGFPHGAVYSPDSQALVGAGTIAGISGLWVVPLTGDGTDCLGMPYLLPTTNGDAIDFVGSVVAAVTPLRVVQPALFLTVQTNVAVIYWSAAYQGFILESTTNLAPPATWTSLPGPYAFDGTFYQYVEPLNNLVTQKFFRLRYIGPTP